MTHVTHPTETRQRWPALLIAAVVVGALVSLALGIYGRQHDPTHESITTFGFSTLTDMKVGLATIAAVLACVQLVTALRIYGKLGRGSGSKAITITHRVSGVLAVLVTLPVAFHCLWSLGFQDYSTRVLAHSILGCAFYGAFVTKMLALKIKGLPGWVIPVLGGTVFAVLIGIAATSALWWYVTGHSTYG
ncbi:MAG: DUF6529 family protein [Candidatus Nanopelagicales bacterium]